MSWRELTYPPGYTTTRLVLGWISHLLIALAIAWAFGFAVAVFFYFAREFEFAFNRWRKGKSVAWMKSAIDVLAAIAGAGLERLIT